MSALKSQKQFLLLPLVAALLIGVFALLQPSSREDVAVDTPTAGAVTSSAVELPVIAQTPVAEGSSEVHAEDCTHCNPVSVEDVVVAGPPVLSTQSQYDKVFKGLVGDASVLNRADFDFLKGSQTGQSVSFQLGGHTFVGKVSRVRESEHSRAYTVAVDGGSLLTVTVDRNQEFSAFLMFKGDSRVVRIKEFTEEGNDADLLASEVSVSDVLCAPKDAVYPLNGAQPSMAGLAVANTKQYSPLAEAAPVALTSESTSGHVLYLDFDGEEVSDDWWNIVSEVDSITAKPHPRANDASFVNSVWLRVVEDFAPFNITVTTDKAVFDAAVNEDRPYLHMIITPTDVVYPGAGGVAGISSYKDGYTRIAWAFNQDEYSAAVTISHEAGHAFGLSHDGPGQVPYVEYYGGHRSGYSEGWAPIMGAPWNDPVGELFYEEVVQWSRGEYADATNQEDDIGIIGGDGNGFGFVADDYADTYVGGGGLDVGILGDVGLNKVGAEGLISSSVDVDVFRFAAIYTGDITLTVNPFDVASEDGEPGSNTQGADLAVQIRLLDENGVVLAAGDDAGAVNLASEIQTTIEAGIYYLEVSGGGRGNNGEDGFTDYGSLGQYTIVGALPTPPLAIFGGEKAEDPVLFGDTSVQKANGTDYGFSYPGNTIVHTFRLVNKGSTPLTDIRIRMASGIDFKIVSLPVMTIPGNGQVYMSIAYEPQQSGAQGIDKDTVVITYQATDPEVFEFAVGGTSTQSANQDNYEDNDRWVDATNLTGQEDVWLSNYKGLAFFRTSIRDMYEISAGKDQLITVEVAYDATDGPITFELHNYYEILGSTSAENGIIQFRVPKDFSGNQLNFVIIATNSADSSVYNAYDLRWSSIELTAGDDDLYEENDTQSAAFDLTGAFSTRLSEYLGEGISNDMDWYKITIPADPFVRMLYVAAEFEHAEGNIDIEVVDENGFNFFPLVSATENDREVVTLHHSVDTEDFAENFSPDGNVFIMGVEPGTYYVRVYGDFAGNSYDLVVAPLRDDRYEVVDSDGTENDDWENAFNLGDTIVDHWLSEIDGIGTCSDYADNATQENFINKVDDDWYEFTVDGLAEQVIVEFMSFDGGIMIFQLYDSDKKFLADSTEPINGGSLILNSDAIVVPSVDTTYFIRVFPFTEVSSLSGYDFRVSVSSEPPFIEGAVEDNYEENDNFKELYNINSNEGLWLTSIDGYGTLLDPDWYEIVVPEGATKLTVKCSFDAAEGNIDLDLSRKDGPTVATSADGGDLETIVVDNPASGAYAIAVIGDYRGNNYNLFWDVVLPEDNYEENDTREEAFDLTDYERKVLRKLDGLGIQKDEDWYHIYAGAGTAELRATATFVHADGDIDMELYNEDGYLYSRSVTTTDNETIIYPTPVEGDYYVRVYYGNEGNEYDFSWAALNAAEVARIRFGEDEYEENDTQGTAYVLTAEQPRLSNLLGLGSQADDDWFEITVPDDNLGLYVECLFDGDDSDLDFEIYDSSGFAIIRRDSFTDNEILDLNGALEGGTYQIRVYGPNLGTPYDLYWVAKVEDVFEDNDIKDDAYPITTQEGLPLSDIGIPTQGDDDWYEIDVTGNYPYIKVTLDYVHLNGSIDFDIRDSTGNNVLVTADSTEDSETVFIPVDPGINYIRVYGDNAYNTYDLIWSLYQDDDYEENDEFDDAADISAEPSIDAVQFDADWYKIAVPTSNSYLAVLATFIGDDGNIDLELYDENEDLVTPDFSSSEENSESFTAAVLAGDYYVKVTGDDVNESYALNWNVDTDDIYDEGAGNDDISTASDIIAEKGTLIPDLRQFDEDWYQVVIFPGEVSLRVDLEFLHANGNLNCAIYDAVGTEVATVDSDTDNELLLYGPDPFGDPAGDTYYIKVNGPGFGTEYTLTWDASNEDIYEGEGNNNGYDDASGDLLGSEGKRISDTTGYAASHDEDWYLVEIASGDDGLVIEAAFAHAADANIDLELFDASRTFKARSVGFGDTERIHFKGAEGTYYLRVFNSLSGNPYDIYWNSYKEDVLESSGEHSKKEKKGEQNDVAVVPDDGAAHGPRRLLQTTMNASYYSDVDPSGAPDLELYLLENLTQLDEDWYVVEVGKDDNIFIVDLQFEHLGGDIDVAVYNRETEVLLAQADTETDGERIELYNLEPGDYLICVYGYGIANPKEGGGWSFDPYTEDYVSLVDDPDFGTDPNTPSYYDLAERNAYGLANTYSLRWNSAFEDVFEENDELDLEAADPAGPNADLGLLDYDDTINKVQIYETEVVQFDDDWFKLVVDTGQSHYLYARINFENNQGNLDLKVYDSEGNLLKESVTSNDYEIIELFSLSATATTYYIQVTGENLGTPYEIRLRTFEDDKYEDKPNENDTFLDAYDLRSERGVSLTGPEGGIQRDLDFYLIEVDKDQVHLFANALPANLTLIGADDLEYTVHDATETALPSGYYSTRVVSPDASLYYIRVTGDDIGSSYNLYWEFDNIDEYEENDISDKAPDLTRDRLQPTWDKDIQYYDPIQDLAFDYSILTSSQRHSYDPFGHAIQESDDWYALQIPSWTLEQVKVGNTSKSALKRIYNVRLEVDVEFTHADGNIDVEIYDADDLTTPIGRVQTENDIESLSVAIDPLSESQVYYIKVSGDNKANSYELKWRVHTDDAYETNNFVHQAFDLTSVGGASTELTWLHEIEFPVDVDGDGDVSDDGFTSRRGYGSQTTDDWYAVVASEGSSEIFVHCDFFSDNNSHYTYGPDKLDVDVEVYQLVGDVVRKPVLIGRLATLTDDDSFVDTPIPIDADVTEIRHEMGVFPISEAGIYFIRVYYDNRVHPYTFLWDDGVSDDAGDQAIIEDYLGYLDGDWGFAPAASLPAALLDLPNANADGDTMPNWAEYALALDASVADTAIVGQSIVEIDGKNYYQFEFLRTKEAVARGYEFIVEESDNMIFSPDVTAEFVGAESINLDVERVFYRSSAPIDEVSNCFFRLKVKEPVAKE